MNPLLYASVTGAILIVVIALLRLLFGKQVSRSVFLVLWLLAVLRLLLPFTLPSPTSIYNLFPQQAASTLAEKQLVEEGSAAEQRPTEELTQPVAVKPLEKQAAPVVLPPAVQEPVLSLKALLTWIWAAVGMCLFLSIELRHLLNRHRYRFSLPLPEGTCVPKGLRVRMLEGLSSPLTYGLFRPTVLLPTQSLACPEQLQHILLHEQAHIRYGDLLKKHLFILTACIHWFNPLAWLMVVLSFEDMEIRCDAVAVGKLGEQHKKAYARTLVSAETARLTDLLQSGFSHSTTARRIQALIHLRRRPVLSAVVCICLVASFALGLMTGPMTLSAQAERPQPPPTEQPSTAQTEQTAPSLPKAEHRDETLPDAEIPDATIEPANSYEALQVPKKTTEETAPPTEETVPPTEETAPPTEETVPPTEETVRPTEETVPPTEAWSSEEAPTEPEYMSYMSISDFLATATVRIQPEAYIGVGYSTKACLDVNYSGTFSTDCPDVIVLEGYVDAVYEEAFGGNFYVVTEIRGAYVTITGLAPGTATVYYTVGRRTFTLFTITVTPGDPPPPAEGSPEIGDFYAPGS